MFTKNWHSIIGPGGLCECGVRANGRVVRCADLLAGDLAGAVTVLERHGQTQGKDFQDIVAVLRAHVDALEGKP